MSERDIVNIDIGAEVTIEDTHDEDVNGGDGTVDEDVNDGDGTDDADVNDQDVGKRKSYTIHHKLAALAALRDNNNNISLTSRRMGISRGNLQRWNKQKNLLDRLREKRGFNIRKQRKDTYKTHGRFVELENLLLEWVREQRFANRPVSGKRLRERAVIIKQDLEIEAPFIASPGWSQRFLKRHGLVRRAVTSVGLVCYAREFYLDYEHVTMP